MILFPSVTRPTVEMTLRIFDVPMVQFLFF